MRSEGRGQRVRTGVEDRACEGDASMAGMRGRAVRGLAPCPPAVPLSRALARRAPPPRTERAVEDEHNRARARRVHAHRRCDPRASRAGDLHDRLRVRHWGQGLKEQGLKGQGLKRQGLKG